MTKYAITGTPGVGKTSASKLLPYVQISLSDYYEEASSYKTEDNIWVVDIENLDKILENIDYSIAEGNFAHKLSNIDKVIVLRCDPDILRFRLEERGYSTKKIKENLEAEALGLIYSESLQYFGKVNVLQLDTSNESVENIAKKIIEYIDGKVKVEEEIDYSERIMDWY